MVKNSPSENFSRRHLLRAAAAGSFIGAPAIAQSRTKAALAYGSTGYAWALPYVAEAAGLWREADVDLTTSAFESGRDAMQALLSGSADFSASTDKYPHELSGGMRQRVAVARALVVEPKVLLMDEPFAAVDAITRQTLQEDRLRLWQETGVSVLFVTHNIDEAIFLVQRVVVMAPHPGTIVSDRRLETSYPRDRGSPAFGELYSEISAQLIGNIRRAFIGVRDIDIVYLRSAACLGASRRDTLFLVVLPAALPFILSGIRQAIAVSLIVLVAAELSGASAGVAYMMSQGHQLFRVDIMFIGLVLLGTFGFLADRVSWRSRDGCSLGIRRHDRSGRFAGTGAGKHA